VKELLSQRGVPWVEKLVDQDRAAAIEMIRRSGQQGVPVTVIGDNVVVGFDRPRLERIIASMKVGTMSGGQAAARSANGRRPLGAKVADAGRYALPGGTAVAGAYIGSIHPGSPAEAAGLKIGDVIVSVDDKLVSSVDDLTAALSKLGSGPVSLSVIRGPNRRTVTVEL
jgi:S1-C subfamily serine protease